MSETYQRLAHSSWDCKYHVVVVAKRQRQVLFGQTRRKLGEVFHVCILDVSSLASVLDPTFRGAVETSATFEARSAPPPYPAGRGW